MMNDEQYGVEVEMLIMAPRAVVAGAGKNI